MQEYTRRYKEAKRQAERGCGPAIPFWWCVALLVATVFVFVA